MSNKVFWLAHVISRSIVPLGGVLLLGWDANNVLLLYFVDTVLAMMVIFAGLAGAFLPGGTASRRTHFAKGAGVVIPVMIVIVAATLPFVLGSQFNWRAVLDDPALRTGVLWQAIAALWSCRDLIRALRDSTPEKLQLERRFGLVLGRWLTLVFVALIVPGEWLGHYVGAVMVATFVVLSIWVEVAPHHFVAGMPDGIEEKTRGENRATARDGLASPRQRRKR